MKSINAIKETQEIEVIEDGFKETVRAGVGCNCKVDVKWGDDGKGPTVTVVAAYYTEVSHP